MKPGGPAKKGTDENVLMDNLCEENGDVRKSSQSHVNRKSADQY